MIESDSVEWSRLRRAIRVSLVATPLVCALVAAIVYLLWYSAVDMHLMAKLTFGVVGVIIAALAGLASSAASNMLARVSRYPLEVAAWGAVVGATAVYLVFYHRQVEWSPVLAILGVA